MEIGVGIVGYGDIARLHQQAICQVPGVRLVAVATSRDRVDLPGVRVYRSYEELLQDAAVALVAVCTPNGAHAGQALAALRAGRHVLVEKPLTLDVESGRRVVDEARRRGLLLSVISQRRLSPTAQQVLAALHRPDVGRPVLGEVHVRWHRDQAYYDAAAWRGSDALDGGVLLNQAMHSIDLLLLFMGPVAEVYGMGATLTHRVEAEDTAVAVLRFRSGALGTISATTSSPVGIPADVTLFCEHGCISVGDYGISRWDVPFPASCEGASGEPERSTGAWSPKEISGRGHVRQWTDVVAALRDGRDPAVTGEAGLASAALALSVRRSWMEGRAVVPEYIGE